MKELLLFRTFVLFPFIGVAGPDVANGLHTSFASLPKEHIIVDLTLIFCLIICSAGIWLHETMELKTPEKNKQGYNSQPMSAFAGQEA